MKQNKYILFFLFIVSFNTFAQSECFDGGNCDNQITLRSEENCASLNQPMVDWISKSESDKFTYINNRLVFVKAPKAPIEDKVGPIRNQGNIGWCFAFAAADMLSSQTNTYLSAAQVAKNYYTKSKISWLWGGKEGGFIPSAIELSLNTPMCEEKTFPSNAKSLNIESAKKIECTEPVGTFENFKTKKFTAAGLYAGHKIFKELDRILSEGEIAGIHYNAGMAIFSSKEDLQSAWANHASTVIGRYFDKNNKTCNYIIRNTWGSGCSGGLIKGVKCLGGYYSIPEEVFGKSLAEVIELKKK